MDDDGRTLAAQGSRPEFDTAMLHDDFFLCEGVRQFAVDVTLVQSNRVIRAYRCLEEIEIVEQLPQIKERPEGM